MAFTPGGVFNLIASYFAQAGATIRTEQHNPVLEDIASGLSQVLVRDGRAPMTGALNMNGFAITNVAAGTSSSSVATLAQAMPIGAVIDFAGSTAPAGWLLCFGQELSRAAYPALFALIGTMFGAGDGSTTFNAPDLRGRVVAGLDAMGGVLAGRLNAVMASGTMGGVGGTQQHTLTAAQMAGHTHGVTTGAFAHTHSMPFPSFTTTTTGGGSFGISIYANSNTSVLTDSTTVPGQSLTTNAGNGLSGTAHLNTQPTMVMNKIIRASYNG